MIDAVVSILTVVEAILALLLITVILLQKAKSAGGLGSLGGEVGESVFGAGTSNVLRRTTVVLAAVFFGITLALAVITGQRPESKSVVETVHQQTSPDTEEAPQKPEETDKTASETVDDGPAVQKQQDDEAASDQ